MCAQRSCRARWLNGAASVVVAALLARLLTGTLLRRLKVIAQFVHRLALGDYSQRLPMRDRDELDQLASDISQLAGKLENIEHNATPSWPISADHAP